MFIFFTFFFGTFTSSIISAIKYHLEFNIKELYIILLYEISCLFFLHLSIITEIKSNTLFLGISLNLITSSIYSSKTSNAFNFFYKYIFNYLYINLILHDFIFLFVNFISSNISLIPSSLYSPSKSTTVANQYEYLYPLLVTIS